MVTSVASAVILDNTPPYPRSLQHLPFSSFTTSAQLVKQVPGRLSKISSKALATSLPQTNALSKILSHSDSELNYFSDKNFDNVNLCVCAVQILSKPDLKGLKHRTLSDKRLDSNRCTCGFLTLEQYKFGKGQGLFPEDELCVGQASKPKAITATGRSCGSKTRWIITCAGSVVWKFGRNCRGSVFVAFLLFDHERTNASCG